MYYSKSFYSLIFTVIFLALVTGCGGGGFSTVNPVPTPSVTPLPTLIPTGTLIIKTAQNNGYATCDLFSPSSVSEPYAQIQLDNIGNGIFKNIPLNITLSWTRLDPGYLSSRKINQDILLFSSGDKSGPGENIIIYRNDEKIGEIYFGEGVILSGLDVHNGNILGVEEGTPGLYLMKY